MIKMEEAVLETVSTITMGTSPKGETYNHDGIGLPLLNGPTEFGLSFPSCTLFTTDSKKECKKGDLIFCVRGSTTGRMNWADKPYSLGRGVCSIRGETLADTKFIRYCIEHKLKALLNLSGGATFPNLTRNDIHKFRIPYPKFRGEIVSILSAYDDLIENNTRRIKILETMAQTLYQEWFVKFRFPGHEQVKMIESDLGLIPEGWEVTELGKLIDIKHGYAFKSKFYSREATSQILLTPGNFAIGGGYQDKKLKYYDGDVSEEFILNSGDLLVTMTDLSKLGDTLGYPAFVPASKELTYLHNQRLGKVLIKEDSQIGKQLLYYIFCSDSYRHHVLASATGSTVKHTAPVRIQSFKIALPFIEIRNKFESIADSFNSQVACLNQKNDNLRKTRDLLLPKLISGQIDVENLDIDTGELAA